MVANSWRNLPQVSSAKVTGAQVLPLVQHARCMNAKRHTQDGARRPASAIRDAARERQKAFLAAVLASNPGITLTDIATRCGVSPSTLTRFMNDPTTTTVLSVPVMALIESAYATPQPTMGFAEPDVTPLAPENEGTADDMGPDRHVWRVGEHFTGLAGYLPGDRLLADMSLQPVDGDDVLVQIEDMRGGATTHLRKFRRGWAFSSADDPEFVDGLRVRVAAVIVKSWRERGK